MLFLLFPIFYRYKMYSLNSTIYETKSTSENIDAYKQKNISNELPFIN